MSDPKRIRQAKAGVWGIVGLWAGLAAAVIAQVAPSPVHPSSGGSFSGGTLTSPLTLSADSCLTFGAGDSAICNEAANTLAQRNSTNAQAFRIYNTFTDASNYERASLACSGGAGAACTLATQFAGTGTSAGLVLFPSNGVVTVNANAFQANSADATDLGGTFTQFKTVRVLRSIEGSKSKALVDATNTEFVRVAIPQTMGSNYAAGQLIYTVYARDATTGTQTLHGIAEWSCINNAGTESCSTIIESQKTGAAVTGGTLTCALTHVFGLTDAIGIQANCDSSLTVTSMTLQYRLDMPQPNTVTPQ